MIDFQNKKNQKFFEMAQKVSEYGGRMYLVGGAVRDAQLGNEPHDMDFCITGLSVEEFNQLFDAPRIQGKDFPVFVKHHCEFALARKERKSGIGHTDFAIDTDKSITIEEDLARRDITINAMAIDVLTGELIDPFGGQKDLSHQIIRATTEAFKEDPLRAYRVARFAAKFGLKVEPNTLQYIEEMKDELSSLSAERVCAEFRKNLLTEHPSLFFETLRKANVLDVHFKEINDLIGVEQPKLYHPEGDAYVHTMEVLEKAVLLTSPEKRFYSLHRETKEQLVIVGQTKKFSQVKMKAKKTSTFFTKDPTRMEQRELIRFCALVHDLGKAATPREEWPHHIGHEESGVECVGTLCHRLKLPKKFEKAGKLSSLLHMKAGKYESLKPSTKVKMIEQIANSRSLSFEGMEVVATCDSRKNIHMVKDARAVLAVHMTGEMKKKCYRINPESQKEVFDFKKAKQLLFQEKVNCLKAREKETHSR